MSKFSFSAIIASILLLAGCSGDDSSQEMQGITVERGDMTIHVEVIDESIIHITKVKQGIEVDSLPDFVTVLKPRDVRWKSRCSGGNTTLSTSKLKLTIDKDGVIEYRDKSGKEFVAESDQATYISTDGSISQGFVAGDEAIYGLGQYQSGIMNLRGVPVRMDQFNQEIVIPFILSTNGYGIYWHNYSSTIFNKAEHQILFENDEIETSEEITTRSDGEVEDVANHATAEINNNIRTTTFTPTKSGLYTFLVRSDDNARMRGEVTLSIDGDEIIHYSTIWMPTDYSGKKFLTAGQNYNIAFRNDGAAIAGEVFYNEPDFDKTTFTSSVGTKIEYYLVAGENPEEVIYNYQDLTGRAPMFPKKSYGFWHCRERFNTQDELLENAREYRERHIPVDNIVQDWFYWRPGTKGPEWDRTRYSDPEAMCEELKELDLNLMVSVWPTITNPPLLKNYGIYESRIGEKGDNLDFYDERVRKEYYNILRDSMFNFGINSIWLDGSEPQPQSISLDDKTVLGEFRKVDNPYSLLVTKSVYEGLRRDRPEERVFNLTRSAYSGQQRYGVASWSGDVAATWEQLAEQIPAGLNFSMAGVPYWTHDIGGFFRDSKSMNPIYDDQYTNTEFKELMSRWFQFGAFSPIFRIHGYRSNTEVWRYGRDFEKLARKYIDLRYKLLPYIYSHAWSVTNESRPFISPLAYQYPNDKRVWDIKDQYLFGESIMVCPVVEYQARSRKIYLPEAEWFNYWNNEKYQGGREVEVSAELDELPLLIKAGSIIPLGPRLQYADQHSSESTRILIYGGQDAIFDLYFDNGEDYSYEDGDFSVLTISYNEEEQSVTLECEHDEYRNFEENPKTFVINAIGGDGDHVVTFDSESKKIYL